MIYSADVDLLLYLPATGLEHRLSHVGRDTLILRGELDLPDAKEGELVIVIDGEPRWQRVTLPDGVKAGPIGEHGRIRTRYSLPLPEQLIPWNDERD